MGKHQGLIRPYQGTFSLLLRLIDIILIMSLLYFSTWFYDIPWHERYAFAGLLAVALLMLMASKLDIYRSWRIHRIREEIIQIWVCWGLAFMSVLVIVFMFKTSHDYSRLVMGSWFVSSLLALSSLRIITRNVLHELRRRGFNTRSVAILGANKLGTDLAERIVHDSWMGLSFDGYYDDRSERIDDELRDSLVGSTEDLIEKANRGDIDIVYITFPMRAEHRVKELIARFSNSTASVYVVPDFNVFNILHGRWMHVGDMPVLSIHENPHSGVDGALKRVEDLLLGSVILALIAVPMLVIALGIKFTSRGPVFFKQRRYGIDGRDIVVWKFRTMSVMEDGEHVLQAQQNDARVTRFGGFLRKTSLDELPQFFNVLKGDMSIVGPRPHAVSHNEEYRKLISGYMLRHKVKPGITGLAQVNGLRGETATLDKMAKRIDYDLEYIRNWSLLLDLKVIALTLTRGFRHKNAY
ncbi:MAG: undecaprenyl-phosphate glucose phosphotransferase [Gammaproteobacteria bacterium]|nr:undecaprenyl-phosphate glucose phosphotransferase [Gammaproteobacteria bacterium]